MSPELLLLLVVFILLPLIQQLLGALRQQRTPDQRTEQPTRGEKQEPRSAAGTRPGRGPARPRVPGMARHRLADAAEHELTAPAVAAAPAMRASPGAPSTRGHKAVAGLRSYPGLRRSIVLMTILGPCRAINPHAWPE